MNFPNPDPRSYMDIQSALQYLRRTKKIGKWFEWPSLHQHGKKSKARLLFSVLPKQNRGNTGKDLIHLSVCLSSHLDVHPCVIPPWWLDGFSSYWYHDQVPWVTDACRIAFSSVPNLSNYGHFVLHFVYLLCYLRKKLLDFIHIWYSNQVWCVGVAYICFYSPS